MQKHKFINRVLYLLVAMVILFSAVPLKKVSAAKKTGWVKEGGYKYYYVKGKKATGFVDVDGKTYYFAVKGHATLPKGATLKGWYKISGDYYCFNRTYGYLEKNTKVDGIKVDGEGKAKDTKYNKKKINLMIRARKMVQSLTVPTDSRGQKRKKVFNYMIKVPYVGYHFLKNIRSKKDWDIIMANDILDENAHAMSGGECTAMSCALAYMLRECRYENVYVVDDDKTLTGDAHSWVELNGKVYDALFARTKGKSNYYNADYNHSGNGADLWPINKKNIVTGKTTSN